MIPQDKHYKLDCQSVGNDLIDDLCGGDRMVKIGFFPLLRNANAKAYILNAVKTIYITSNANEQDHISFGYTPAEKKLTVSVNLIRILSLISAVSCLTFRL